MIHDLKCHPGPFEEARQGRKPYEVRRADRPYAEGDQVLLREWDPFARAYTGRELRPRLITSITRGYGLLDGYVVLGFAALLPGATLEMLNQEARLKTLDHLVTPDAMAFQLIAEHPDQAAQIAEQALARIQQSAA